ncbi:MAG: hypothetical protein KA761_05165 [Gemmatimonadaceae bacterium]|jgi:hypothetical protein|nr:hypothetical protein [Gemmatimonadaceae bacterium]
MSHDHDALEDRELREAAALERRRTYGAPELWPQIAARTVHREAVRREVLRSLRRPLMLWLLVAFVLGVVATEAVRALTARTASASAVIPRGDLRSLEELRRVR